MKTISGKQFCRIIEKKGWILKRIHGSHHIYTLEGNPARLSVPIHGNKSLKVGLQLHLMKIAGIDEKEL
ncbi:type II toxin-antitoxin system HicA family toxin [bacterium]|nr:type II toxin-antitoxin system HicA family toxin [bacterium]